MGVIISLDVITRLPVGDYSIRQRLEYHVPKYGSYLQQSGAGVIGQVHGAGLSVGADKVNNERQDCARFKLHPNFGSLREAVPSPKLQIRST